MKPLSLVFFDGIELARAQLPDIILLDLMMPDMSGEQVADELNASEQTARIPKIYLTALATKDDTGSNVLKKKRRILFCCKAGPYERAGHGDRKSAGSLRRPVMGK